eukprot:SM000009S23516  [mRNA]  locus=s9:502213:505295:+ [translate_table: standard]
MPRAATASGKRRRRPILEADPGNGAADGNGADGEDYGAARFEPERHRLAASAGGGAPLDGQRLALAAADGPAARRFFAWLLAPVSVKHFYARVWERRPLLVRRPHHRSYYSGWFSMKTMRRLLQAGQLQYGTNIDVTRYCDGARQTLNGQGLADPAVVWKHYNDGCSLRILHPQQWSNPLWLMLSALEVHWNCIAGAQGFSPHYDDIEAFILQIEGKKRWRCYAPRTKEQILPRTSSPDFTQEEIGEPIMTVTLEPGDLLYMPRGTIHQAISSAGSHSLHLTISTAQSNSFIDYLETVLPRALQLASEDLVALRRSLPSDWTEYMGVVHSDSSDARREAILRQLRAMVDAIFKVAPWDSAADQMAANFLLQRLPLRGKTAGVKDASSEAELQAAFVDSSNASLDNAITNSSSVQNGRDAVKLRHGQGVALVAPNVGRLVIENDAAVIYHMLGNSRRQHNVGNQLAADDEEEEAERGRLSFPLDCAPALERLVLAYPEIVRIADLPMDSKKECVAVAQALYDAGLLRVTP